MIFLRDRDNLTKRLNEEHDQRRIEAMEVCVQGDLGKCVSVRVFQKKILFLSMPYMMIIENYY